MSNTTAVTTTKSAIRIDELVFTSVLVLFVAWYLFDTYGASAKTENIILVVPVGVVCLLLGAYVLIEDVFLASSQQEEARTASASKSLVLAVMVVFGLFCVGLDVIGFDAATGLFVGTLLFLQGERRIKILLAYSILFALLVSLFFEFMLPYPMPMLLGREFLGI